MGGGLQLPGIIVVYGACLPGQRVHLRVRTFVHSGKLRLQRRFLIIPRNLRKPGLVVRLRILQLGGQLPLV